MTTTRLLAAALALTLATLSGCVGGPSYAGGPTEEEPHGLVIPGDDVFIWAVDGRDVSSRRNKTYVEPGHRRLKIRFNYPIDNESANPYEFKDLDLNVEDGRAYLIERKGEGQFGPYELEVRGSPRRR
ncbi:MAG: hypothetical protein KF878_36570 [Planctomycetes bacterium]|nr:hypothetical protein [Planctomycetota bacterium]